MRESAHENIIEKKPYKLMFSLKKRTSRATKNFEKKFEHTQCHKLGNVSWRITGANT